MYMEQTGFSSSILQGFCNHTSYLIFHYLALRVRSNHTSNQVCCYLDKTPKAKTKHPNVATP